MDTVQEELSKQVDQAQWEWLRAHNERGALIVVDQMLEIVEVGERIAADDLSSVQAWLASGLIAKPKPPQVAEWDQDNRKRFTMLVINPYVLIQEVTE